MNKKFLWGGSTSAFQFEGGGLLGKKGKSIYDIREEKTGIRYSEASDFYHHYKEDIQLLKEMGFNSLECPLHGLESIQQVSNCLQMKRGLRSISQSSKNSKMLGLNQLLHYFIGICHNTW